jgi:hypothetical protein
LGEVEKLDDGSKITPAEKHFLKMAVEFLPPATVTNTNAVIGDEAIHSKCGDGENPWCSQPN